MALGPSAERQERVVIEFSYPTGSPVDDDDSVTASDDVGIRIVAALANRPHASSSTCSRAPTPTVPP
jgi:hypothetical protein